ncbi:MAG: hypothetical protein JEZ09_05375 [Salinivirgaceae bacterium]|nr:hypothetical protein [Salinivirgaceae bacterium]
MPSTFFKLFIAFISSLIVFNGFGKVTSRENIINYLQNTYKIKNQIWGIENDPTNGMVYFATHTGLLEFDGLTFHQWETPEQKFIRSIKIDSTGIIFTGGFESFGYWEPDPLCALRFHTLSDSMVMNRNDEIWKIYLDTNAVLFQSFTTIYKYNYKTIEKFPAPGFMLFMFKVNNRFIVQILDKGLYYFNNNEYTFIEGSEQFQNIKIHSIISFDEQNLLICTEKKGVFKYDFKTFSYWDTPISDYLKIQTCNAASQLSDTTFVFGTIFDGIVIANKSGNIEDHYNFGNGLSNNTVLSFCASKDRGLWVGLDEGVNYINQTSSVSYYSTANGSLGTIYSLLKDGNTLYLGSNHGLFRSEIIQKGSSPSFSKLSFVPNSQGQVWTLSKIDGEILCGHNEGTYKVTPTKFKNISTITGGWVLKPYDDLLLEGTYTGLITFSKSPKGEWTYRNKLKGFSEPTRHLEIDYLGYIWVSHPQKGIYRLKVNDAKDSIVSISEFTHLKKTMGLTDVYKLNNRVVFLAEKEFYTFDYVNDSMVPFDALNNALGEYKQSSQIIPFEKNIYWFVYKNKLALFRISIEFTPVKLSEYLISDACMPGQDLAIMPLNYDDFLMSNRNGLAILKKINKITPSQEPDMFLKNIFFHGRKKSKTICTCEKDIMVPFYLNNVTFRFADPSTIDLTSTKYKYRIKEIDDQWIYTESPEIRYYHLKPDTYHLQIANDSNLKILTQVFTIKPPFYFTYWAFMLYLVLVLGAGWLFYRIVKIKLAKQRKLLEFEVKQTTLENRLQNTNVELMLTLRYLIQKNESLQKLQDEINRVKETPGNIPVKFIKRLDTYISQGLELQTKEWKMALHNLKLSQEGYFKRLKENYPLLTNNDIRLCSYLRMNFSSKEIAHLLNISTRAVEISRYRLRKKLNMEHDKNLSDFLMQDEV